MNHPFLNPIHKDHDMNTEDTNVGGITQDLHDVTNDPGGVVHDPHVTEGQDLASTMTPERRAFEEAKMSVEKTLQMAGQYMNQAVTTLANTGVVVTIETVPLREPGLAMGNYELGITCRPMASLRKQLDELKAAAEASEQPKTDG